MSQVVVEAKNIELTVPGRANAIVNMTNLKITQGEFVVILGHNGSGKSSLIKMLSGNKKPTMGEVFLNKMPLNLMAEQVKAREIITITQNPEESLFVELTLKENIILWEERFAGVAMLGIDQIISKNYKPERFKEMLNQEVWRLSGGEKQMFLLNLALAHPPSILFLDEHTSALDPKAADEIMSLTATSVKENKITTIMVTHRLEDAINYGNRVVIMNEGIVTYDFSKTSDLSVSSLKQMME